MLFVNELFYNHLKTLYIVIVHLLMSEIECIFLLLLITFINSYDVYFELDCDDFCHFISQGTNVKDIDSAHNHYLSVQRFHFNISFDEPLIIEIQHKTGPYGLGGYTVINFTYFKIKSSAQYKQLWTIGKEEEECYQTEITGGSIYLETHIGNVICTITLSLNFCKQDGCIVNYPYNEVVTKSFTLKDNLIVDWINPDYQRMKVTLHFLIPLTEITILDYDNKPIVNGSTYSLDDQFQLISNGNVQDKHIDSIIVKYLDETESTIFANCQMNFIACGEGCLQCNQTSCLKCANNYAFIYHPYSENCVLKSNYPSNGPYKLKNKNGIEYFYQCYSSCDGCYDDGNDTIHRCQNCKNGFDF